METKAKHLDILYILLVGFLVSLISLFNDKELGIGGIISCTVLSIIGIPLVIYANKKESQ